ncbi:hypothetical protein G6F40_015346 [Rhizopus arrhizus]|nr:hypothetical protein G6F40_015346 [Rhizopus arrhizus]
MKYSRFSSGSGGNTEASARVSLSASRRGKVRHRALYCSRACSWRSAWRAASTACFSRSMAARRSCSARCSAAILSALAWAAAFSACSACSFSSSSRRSAAALASCSRRIAASLRVPSVRVPPPQRAGEPVRLARRRTSRERPSDHEGQPEPCPWRAQLRFRTLPIQGRWRWLLRRRLPRTTNPTTRRN